MNEYKPDWPFLCFFAFIIGFGLGAMFGLGDGTRMWVKKQCESIDSRSAYAECIKVGTK